MGSGVPHLVPPPTAPPGAPPPPPYLIVGHVSVAAAGGGGAVGQVLVEPACIDAVKLTPQMRWNRLNPK